jgi:formylglycine-generating enzyme required for sulfatase activity
VVRGGGWFSGPYGCRAAYRFSGAPAGRGNYFGFRVCFRLD